MLWLTRVTPRASAWPVICVSSGQTLEPESLGQAHGLAYGLAQGGATLEMRMASYADQAIYKPTEYGVRVLVVRHHNRAPSYGQGRN